MRPPRSSCSARSGRHDRAAGAGRGHRPVRRRGPDRGAAAHRGPPPPAPGPHPAAGHAAGAGRSPARPPDPHPPGADRPARRRPGTARRDRPVEKRPAPAHLPADRADFRLGRRCPGQGRIRRPALAYSRPDLQRPGGGQHPRPVQAGLKLAGGGLDRRRDLLPAPAPRHQRLRRPRSLLGAPLRRRPRPGQRAVLRLLRLRRHHDARRTPPPGPRAGPADDRLLLPHRPGPRHGPGANPDSPRRHPARRHPGRLRLRTPRRRRLGHPAPPPAPSSSRTCTPPTAAPAAPTTAPSSPTGTCTAPPPRRRSWNSGRSPATPPPSRPPRTTSSPPNSPGTSSGRSPPATPTATTG